MTGTVNLNDELPVTRASPLTLTTTDTGTNPVITSASYFVVTTLVDIPNTLPMSTTGAIGRSLLVDPRVGWIHELSETNPSSGNSETRPRHWGYSSGYEEKVRKTLESSYNQSVQYNLTHQAYGWWCCKVVTNVFLVSTFLHFAISERPAAAHVCSHLVPWILAYFLIVKEKHSFESQGQ